MGLPLEFAHDQRIYSITQITREIKATLETAFPPIWVEGEISNFKKHSSGHFYFVLKDENAQLQAVMWRGHNLRLFFTPQDGMKVLAQGSLTVYEKRGTYQLEVTQLQPAGIGELQLAYEQLKRKLNDEGLFAAEHKKAIPEFPERIGIVTSPTGAALRDLVTILNRRFPSVEIILAPVRVQGDGAADEIAQAITDFNRYGAVDVLIVGRGGGSLEDLWPFNEENVARAIYASKIPVISAVGHEIDFSIADFVADLRASTPSAAAELAVHDRIELNDTIQSWLSKMFRLLHERITYYQEKVNHLQGSYALRRPADVIKQHQQRLDELVRSLELQFEYRIEQRRQLTDSLRKQLFSLSPLAVLQRGYTICFREDDGKLLKLASEADVNDRLRIQFRQGQLRSRVEEILPEQMPDLTSPANHS